MTRDDLREKAYAAIAQGHTSVILHVRRKRAPKEDCTIVPHLRARCIGYRPESEHATLSVNAQALADWCDKHVGKHGIWTLSVDSRTAVAP